MGKVFLYKNGGGTSLNFVFKTYATQALLEADTPRKNNTIGLVTTTPVGDYQFSATVPTTRSDGSVLQQGDVWVQTKGTSIVPFNCINPNSIMVYPNGVYQYINAVWLLNTYAKIYQNGSWRAFYNYIYRLGTQYYPMSVDFTSYTAQFTTNYIYFECNSSQTSSATTVNKIAVTAGQKLVFKYDIGASNGGTVSTIFAFLANVRGINPYGGTYVLKTTDPNNTLGAGLTLTANIVTTGEYYIGVAARGQMTAAVTELYLMG